MWRAKRQEAVRGRATETGHIVSKRPSVPAEYKGDSAIPESSAIGDNYFTDHLKLKTDG